MLQQTRSPHGDPRYWGALDGEGFRPVASLASAHSMTMLARGAGSGYYSRARNLWRGARPTWMASFRGARRELRAVPGIGPTPPGRSASIRVRRARPPLVTANVARVLAACTRSSTTSSRRGHEGPCGDTRRADGRAAPRPPHRAISPGSPWSSARRCAAGPRPALLVCPLAAVTAAAARTGRTDELPVVAPGKSRGAGPILGALPRLDRGSGELVLARRRRTGVWRALGLPSRELRAARVVLDAEPVRAAIRRCRIAGARDGSCAERCPCRLSPSRTELRRGVSRLDHGCITFGCGSRDDRDPPPSTRTCPWSSIPKASPSHRGLHEDPRRHRQLGYDTRRRELHRHRRGGRERLPPSSSTTRGGRVRR